MREEGMTNIQPVPDFLALAGSIDVPPAVRGISWDQIKQMAYRMRKTNHDTNDHASRPTSRVCAKEKSICAKERAKETQIRAKEDEPVLSNVVRKK